MKQDQAMSIKPLEDIPSTREQFERKLVDVQADYPLDGDIPIIEVTKELFQALLKGRKGAYLTYGDPGVKVFVQGTVEDIEREENLSADEFHRLSIERMRADRASEKSKAERKTAK